MELYRLVLVSVMLLFCTLCDASLQFSQCTAPESKNSPNFFQYKIAGLSKREVIDFGDYTGNVVLAVNVATF